MPIIKAAKKYMRVSKRKRAQNQQVRGVAYSAAKRVRSAVAKKDLAQAQEWFLKAQKAMDKAVQKKTLKKNTASRLTSRLSALVKTLKK